MILIEIGELVCMPRRRTKGMGIVLGISTPDTEIIQSLLEIANMSTSWEERINKEQLLLEKVEDREFISNVMTHCTDQTGRSLRRVFAKVHWFRSPSYYTMDRLPNGEKWVPLIWLKNLRDR